LQWSRALRNPSFNAVDSTPGIGRVIPKQSRLILVRAKSRVRSASVSSIMDTITHGHRRRVNRKKPCFRARTMFASTAVNRGRILQTWSLMIGAIFSDF